MKLENLYQDPQSEAPYADALVLDQGGMDLKYGGDTIAHVSFEGLDPFEIAFHAMPADWEPHEEWDDKIGLLPVTPEQIVENGIYHLLSTLGKLKGWERK